MRIDLLGDDWSSASDEAGYRWRRMRVAGAALGASLYELPPGERTWKYHYEVGNDELLVVVSGRPSSGRRAVRRSCVRATASSSRRGRRARTSW